MSNNSQGLGCFFWLVILPIVVFGLILNGFCYLINLWFKSGDEMDKKRRITNIIGIVVLGTIIIGVTVERGVQYLRERERIKNAEALSRQMANDLAEAFINDSSGDLVMKWARNDGEYVDVWGNQFKLIHSSIDKGVQVASAGADGEFDTDDDVLSEVHSRKKDQFKIDVDEARKRLEGAGRKVKEALEDVEVETEKEERGWKFRFSWGNKDDKED